MPLLVMVTTQEQGPDLSPPHMASRLWSFGQHMATAEDICGHTGHF